MVVVEAGECGVMGMGSATWLARLSSSLGRCVMWFVS